MTERPILFSGPMVRAILDGRKTQTRRIVKPQPELTDGAGFKWKGWLYGRGAGDAETVRNFARQCCPYGAPGDRLWVRETWSNSRGDDSMPTHYKADGRLEDLQLRWRPSIHMPRWASRITLEVVNVRVERLQEIGAKDILAEGAVARAHDDQFGHNPVSAFDGCVYLDLVSLWARGWDSINAKRAPWESNPYVWVIEFRRVP